MPAKELISIQFAQLANSWLKTRNNNYSDKNKESYSQSLEDLFDKLNKDVSDKIQDSEILDLQKIIDFFNTSITYLNDSTYNQTPIEVIDCLMIVLNEWIDDSFIISTSFTNENKRYYFNRELLTDIYKIIEAKYAVKFHSKLIQIGIPRLLVRDYFFNAIMYHELGHFIDQHFKISQRIAYDLANQSIGDLSSLRDYQHYLPILNEQISLKSQKYTVLKSHISEYFSDIFASQYIGNSLNYYLSHNNLSASHSHPSNDNRINFVNSFMKQENTPLFVFINEKVLKITGNSIHTRYEKPESFEIFHFLPLEIENDKQIHGLFPMIYEILYSYNQDFEQNNSIDFELEPTQIYGILNNLVEKSISNYFVRKNWEAAKLTL